MKALAHCFEGGSLQRLISRLDAMSSMLWARCSLLMFPARWKHGLAPEGPGIEGLSPHIPWLRKHTRNSEILFCESWPLHQRNLLSRTVLRVSTRMFKALKKMNFPLQKATTGYYQAVNGANSPIFFFPFSVFCRAFYFFFLPSLCSFPHATLCSLIDCRCSLFQAGG